MKFSFQLLIQIALLSVSIQALAQDVRTEVNIIHHDGTSERLVLEIPQALFSESSTPEDLRAAVTRFLGELKSVDVSTIAEIEVSSEKSSPTTPKESLWVARLKPALFRLAMNGTFGTIGAYKWNEVLLSSPEYARFADGSFNSLGSSLAIGLGAVGGTGFVLNFLNKEVQWALTTGAKNLLALTGMRDATKPYYNTAYTTSQLFVSLMIEFAAVTAFYAGIQAFGIDGAKSIAEFVMRVALGVGVGFVGQTAFEIANAEKTDREKLADPKNAPNTQKRSDWRVAWMSAVTSFNQISVGGLDLFTGAVIAATTGFGLTKYVENFLEKRRIARSARDTRVGGGGGGSSCVGVLNSLITQGI